MAFTPKQHNCKENKNGDKVETTMMGVNEEWLIYNKDPDEPDNIIYEINYCPFCGARLPKKDGPVKIKNIGGGSFRMVED